MPLPEVGVAGVDHANVRCRNCSRVTTLSILPALTASAMPVPPPLAGEDAPGPGEAACFYNPSRRATQECSHCGVLISDPWAARWGGQTVCLKCLEHLRSKGKDSRFEGSRMLWDNLALVLALVPFTFILWWAFFITAPAAIFISLYHWNSPRSMVPRGRWRLVLALILSLLQVGGLVAVILGLWFRADWMN